MAKRSADDEKMLTEIAKTNINFPQNKLAIFDARSWTVAQANRFKGGGLEDTKYYTQAEVFFCDIDNIHGVRDAMTEMHKLAWTPGVMDSPHNWHVAVEQTNYF
jgi:phosphatidylinositol-3-phosphatase